MKLYTIGHSNHPADKFIHLLNERSISLLADVRSTPYSRFNPHFNKNALLAFLSANGTQYAYMGDRLGGRPKDPQCYIHHAIPTRTADFATQIRYAEVMKRPWFIGGITELFGLAVRQATCIMCSEKDPAMCHRHHLIAAYLSTTHPEVDVLHILPGGNLVKASTIGFEMD
jgi:uncharacterized protein (DUF488 family)